MSGYEYIARDARMDIKKFVIHSLNCTQNYMQNQFSFKYIFIGNEPRCLVTRNISEEIGDEYDIEIRVNDPHEYFTPKGIFSKFKQGLIMYYPPYQFTLCEDNDYILEATMKNKKVNNLLLQINFIITKVIDGKNYILRYNKKEDYFYWIEKEIVSNELLMRERWCKDLNYWNELRELFLIERNKEENKYLKSREIYEKVLNYIYETKE